MEEADYVCTIAQWHESSDGRSLRQLERLRFNYKMLNFILEKWMPWYGECYDFSTIDVNRYDNLKRYNYVLKTSNDKAIFV